MSGMDRARRGRLLVYTQECRKVVTTHEATKGA
jgi:hypothetical protein